MSSREQGKQSPRPRLPRRRTDATNLFARQTVQLAFIAPPDRTLPYAEQCPIQNRQILALMYGRFFTSSVRIGIRPTILGFIPSA